MPVSLTERGFPATDSTHARSERSSYCSRNAIHSRAASSLTASAVASASVGSGGAVGRSSSTAQPADKAPTRSHARATNGTARRCAACAPNDPALPTASQSARVAGPELAIAGVAEPGHDVALLVEPAIERRAVDLDIRMRGLDRCDPFGRGDQVDELDADRLDGAPALQNVDRRGGRAAGGEHRVEDEAQVDRRRVGQLVVVLDRAERALVAEQAEMPDLRRRHQLEHRVDHAEARAEDGDEPDALAELARFHGFHRCLDPEGPGLRVLERLV